MALYLGTDCVDIASGLLLSGDAADITYDNTDSGLASTNVKEALDELENGKVDKEEGKGLSTNDYDNTEKEKVANAIANPSGGTTGQILKKTSTGTEWADDQGGLLPQFLITVETGSTVTATKDGESVAGVETSTDVYLADIPSFGTWTITATKDGSEASTTIVVEEIKRYSVSLSYYELYEMQINQVESGGVVSSMVEYLGATIGMTPAGMNYAQDAFDYGDWENAFFHPRPCMLKYDGTVDYYLDPSDYTKREDGVTPSDIANTSYGGNAMIEWGQNGKKIWLKIEPNTNGAKVSICDKQLDDGFNAWSFINHSGVLVDHFYTPIYNGSNINSKLRSISGQTPINTQTASTEISYAQANNPSGQNMWLIDLLADRLLINFLLVLMGKSTDTQTVYGQGYHTGGSQSSNPRLTTGTMNTKGMFYGKNTADMNGVKVFGMENWWGNQWRRMAGLINANGTIKCKLTNGTQDGSTAAAYNLDGSGYLTVPNCTPAGTSGGYINNMVFTDKGMFAKTASGSASTYYCDGLWFNNSQNNYALVGGASDNGLLVGAFCVDLLDLASASHWSRGAALSCKPLS